MISVILLMAGKGQRMNNNINKVLLPLGDKLIYEHSLELFLKYNCEVICVISKDDANIIDNLPRNCKYTFGGKTRMESVYNGLKLCTNDYVLVHDAARPLLSQSILEEILNIKNPYNAILTYLDVKDTIKEKGAKIVTLDRNNLIAAATPQCAPLTILKDAYEKAMKENYIGTDDISLIEKYLPHIQIDLIKTNEECFKITTNTDYLLAKLILENKHD